MRLWKTEEESSDDDEDFHPDNTEISLNISSPSRKETEKLLRQETNSPSVNFLPF
jgi:hypothetical protein